MKFGIEGYGLYFACIEIIASELTTDNITFELEHDAEILAYKFKIDTLLVEEIMKYCVKLELFQFNPESHRIACYKLASRLDKTMSQNLEIKAITKNYQSLPKTTSNRKQIRLNKNRLEEKKEEKHKYGEYSHVLLTDEEYKKIQDKTGDVKKWIKALDEGIELKGYKYKSHYLAILKWHSRDDTKTPGKIKSTYTPIDKLSSEEIAETARQATELAKKYGGSIE